MIKAESMTPYLIRGLHEWCTDNGLTAQIAVKVDDATQVPAQYVKNGEVILNISYDATRHLKISNDYINFSARFSGVSHEIAIPVRAVFGFFAKETGQGIAFGSDDRSNFSGEKGKGTKIGKEKSTKRTRLQLVK